MIIHLFKVLFGSVIGTLVGLAIGVSVSYLTYRPYNPALGSQDSQAMAQGAVVIVTIFTGGLLGLVIGTLTSIILNVRAAHQHSSSD